MSAGPLEDRWRAVLLMARTQALAPDLRRKVDANRAARMAQERVLKQQIEAQASHLSFLGRSTRITCAASRQGIQKL